MANDYLDLEGLSTFLNGLFGKFAIKKHTHTKSEIKDYVVDSVLSLSSTNPVENKVVNAKFDVVDDAINSLQITINNKSDTSHDHNDVYYTKTAMDGTLSSMLTNVAFIDENDNETVVLSVDIEELSSLVGGNV